MKKTDGVGRYNTLRQRLSDLSGRLEIERYRYPIVVFVVLRLWTSFWAYISVAFVPAPGYVINQMYGMPPLSGNVNQLLWAPWQRWDTIWYTKIAEQGYWQGNLSPAYFPLYPTLIKIFAPLFGNSVAAGVVIATIAALASFVMLYKLTDDQYGYLVARRAVLYLAGFPTAFYLFGAYTESLFLALVLGMFVSVKAKRWGLGSIIGGLAALTRPQGMLLVLPLAIEFILQYRRGEIALKRAVSIPIVGASGIAFWVFLAFKFGDPLIWFKVQSWWHRASWPWESIGAALGLVVNAQNAVDALISLPDGVFALLFLGFTLWSAFRLSSTFSAYMVVIVFPPLLGLTTYSPLLPLASMSRYVVVAFPAFILLGRAFGPSLPQCLIVTLSFLLQTFWLILFAAWIFVG
jgi:hypothetical protein